MNQKAGIQVYKHLQNTTAPSIAQPVEPVPQVSSSSKQKLEEILGLQSKEHALEELQRVKDTQRKQGKDEDVMTMTNSLKKKDQEIASLTKRTKKLEKEVEVQKKKLEKWGHWHKAAPGT